MNKLIKDYIDSNFPEKSSMSFVREITSKTHVHVILSDGELYHRVDVPLEQFVHHQ